MYKHHQVSIENLLFYFQDDKNILAVILAGSIAKGLERADSDIDAIVVTTDERYMELSKSNKLSECIYGHCTYEGGYFDIKYCTKGYLAAVAQQGSEPSRNAFIAAKCLYCDDDEIAEIVPQIGVFQTSEKPEKMLSFYSAFSLNHGYFWSVSENNTYLRVRTAADIVLFGYRLLLQNNEILFPCHKGLSQTVMSMENKPDRIVEKERRLLTQLSNDAKNDFVDSILNFIDYVPPQDYPVILTRFIDDNELWWYKGRPVITEW